MDTSILIKEEVIKILHRSQSKILPYQSTNVGAAILYEIGKALTDLNCCIKSIVHYAHIQHRIVCLLEDTYHILETEPFHEVQVCIKRLRNSICELDDLSIKEIKGENCQSQFVNYGFDKYKYNSVYEIPQ